ncbi:hypothetical protein TNCT_299231 [Trichonephila clavata]|uniref:Uncharacterized protein n=1 Tax=Trichonephila clavata TaxID=2740835 RepID=A0A8X6LCS2_TRICU|nr:hypothetical protein TNCT_299231 [Trichonephila clavata]
MDQYTIIKKHFLVWSSPGASGGRFNFLFLRSCKLCRQTDTPGELAQQMVSTSQGCCCRPDARFKKCDKHRGQKQGSFRSLRDGTRASGREIELHMIGFGRVIIITKCNNLGKEVSSVLEERERNNTFRITLGLFNV